MKTSFHSLIPFLPLFCSCQLNSIHVLPGWRPKLDSILLNWILLYNNLARTTQKTQPLYCWEGVFTAPLHSDGSYSIISYVFVAAGMCLPSRCLAMNTIPTFGRHITLWTFWRKLHLASSCSETLVPVNQTARHHNCRMNLAVISSTSVLTSHVIRRPNIEIHTPEVTSSCPTFSFVSHKISLFHLHASSSCHYCYVVSDEVISMIPALKTGVPPAFTLV
jgi:hypothetical protein